MSDSPASLSEQAQRALGAFTAYGLELEYTIVYADTLDIASAAPQVLRRAAGVPDSAPAPEEARAGELAWSNELVSHVIELKNPQPRHLEGLGEAFHEEVRAMNRRLAPLGLRLMPGGMHPWMAPQDAQLWGYGNAVVYQAFDRVFGCRGHGWTNVQSTHINLPFRGDAQFARLHSAIRLVLPLIPALAASSPFAEGRRTAALDFRMSAYRHHADSVPSVIGPVIPECFDSRARYEQELLQPMYRDIAARDPQGVLRHEWLNARGAIARFDRSAVEIRVMDVQECPAMDVGLAAAVIDSVWWLYRAGPSPVPTGTLAQALDQCTHEGERTRITSGEYLSALGVKRSHCTAGEVWRALAERLQRDDAPHTRLWSAPLDLVLARGPLARRMLRVLGDEPNRVALAQVYSELCDCLESGNPFDP